jgi:hypothetical protein
LTDWAPVFLGIIAAATLLMAITQVGAIIYGLMLARRIARLLDRLEQETRPILDSLNAFARDAARASSLAVSQVERFDKLVSDLTVRIEETASTVQKAIGAPLRDGAAVLAGVRAALAVLKGLSSRSGNAGARADEEDALFIG